MIRRLALLLLGLVLLTPAAGAQTRDYTDYKTEGTYKEFAQYIATTYYDKVLQHPHVAKALQALTGPYYERMSNLVDVTPIRYAPKHDIVLEGYTTRSAYDSPFQEKVMIVMDWYGVFIHAALRSPDETLIFAGARHIDELLDPLGRFVREKEIREIETMGAREPWIRILDYRRTGNPQTWPPAP
jgi:hypothetical protein